MDLDDSLAFPLLLLSRLEVELLDPKRDLDWDGLGWDLTVVVLLALSL